MIRTTRRRNDDFAMIIIAMIECSVVDIRNRRAKGRIKTYRRLGRYDGRLFVVVIRGPPERKTKGVGRP